METVFPAIVGLVVIGAVAGVLSGLFGIGGGVIIVPALLLWFGMQGLHDDVAMPCALGTSLGTIIVTALSSIRAHQARAAIRWPAVRAMTPGVLVGAVAGAMIAHALRSDILKMLFGVFLIVVALQLVWRVRVPAARTLPRRPALLFGGGVIGMLSSLFGIGGGTLSVPFLMWNRVPMVQAVATASAIGLPLALAGTAGYVVTGWEAAGLPSWSLGYVALVPLAILTPASVMFAPLGARLAHRAPQQVLQRLFALVIVMVALRLLWSGESG
jgi:uncharacterized protein